MKYETYIFDLYGTLVDIHTEEEEKIVWEKLALFYGYYDAIYDADTLKKEFRRLIEQREAGMQQDMKKKSDAHEAFPEVSIEEIFLELFRQKGVPADETLAIHAGQFFRVLTTDYIRLYPGAEDLLSSIIN